MTLCFRTATLLRRRTLLLRERQLVILDGLGNTDDVRRIPLATLHAASYELLPKAAAYAAAAAAVGVAALAGLFAAFNDAPYGLVLSVVGLVVAGGVLVSLPLRRRVEWRFAEDAAASRGCTFRCWTTPGKLARFSEELGRRTRAEQAPATGPAA